VDGNESSVVKGPTLSLPHRASKSQGKKTKSFTPPKGGISALLRGGACKNSKIIRSATVIFQALELNSSHEMQAKQQPDSHTVEMQY